MKKYNIAVVGATGIVGKELIYLLEKDKIIGDVYVVASDASLGKKLSFRGDSLSVDSIEIFDFSKVDIAFFAVDSKISQLYVQKAVDSGAVVIDKSSLYRMDPDVPLIVPSINPSEISRVITNGIVANPNCCVVPLATVLYAIYAFAEIKNVYLSTYQSVSGAGRQCMDELFNQTRSRITFQECDTNILDKPIAFNVIPQIGDFCSDDYTDEEEKIFSETKRILNKEINVSATCVRVPVFVGHTMSVTVELDRNINIDNILSRFKSSSNILYKESCTPLEIEEREKIIISRLRIDRLNKNVIHFWLASDNLILGAAKNSYDILGLLIENDLV